jgi:hypothetical protein
MNLREGLGDGDPWAIQVLKNSAKFRAKTGFAPGNHRMYELLRISMII